MQLNCPTTSPSLPWFHGQTFFFIKNKELNESGNLNQFVLDSYYLSVIYRSQNLPTTSISWFILQASQCWFWNLAHCWNVTYVFYCSVAAMDATAALILYLVLESFYYYIEMKSKEPKAENPKIFCKIWQMHDNLDLYNWAAVHYNDVQEILLLRGFCLRGFTLHEL